MPVVISDSASVDDDEVELCESRCGCTHGCEHGPGDLNNTCSGLHYVCEKCNKRVGSNWVICTLCVEDHVYFYLFKIYLSWVDQLQYLFMAVIINICVCMIQDTRMAKHSIPYEHKAQVMDALYSNCAGLIVIIVLIFYWTCV